MNWLRQATEHTFEMMSRAPSLSMRDVSGGLLSRAIRMLKYPLMILSGRDDKGFRWPPSQVPYAGDRGPSGL